MDLIALLLLLNTPAPMTEFMHVGTVNRLILLQENAPGWDPGPCGDGTKGAIVITEPDDDGRERWVQCSLKILCSCAGLTEGDRVLFTGSVVGGYEPGTGELHIGFVAEAMMQPPEDCAVSAPVLDVGGRSR